MKKTVFLAFFTGMSFVMYAQHSSEKVVALTEVKKDAAADAKTVVPEEQTLVLKEDVYDFGKIPQGKPVNHIFEVANTGKAPLKILNVQASCGCTTPEWEKDMPIPAGGNSKITVGYNAASEGPFTKLVTITYNESLNKTITIKGEVWKTPASSAPENSGLNDLKN